ncbi:MAG TPA: PilZ domain-containing protein [Myxococcales bacterium LLY-WYZ-16_1]|nr:PilZ domain-containing protein [Myxococcales bacterium LLY-WYZ-16_1]
MSQANRADRHQVELKLVYDDGEHYASGRVRDASDTGLFLETPEPAPVGTVLTLFPLDPEADRLFELHVEVVRVEPDDPDTHRLGGMGLKFLEPDSVIEQIHALIEALERAQHGPRDPLLGVRIPARRGAG